MLQHLKAWWATHLTLIAAVVGFFNPSVQTWLTQHPQSSLLISGAWSLLLHHLQPPRNFANRKGSQHGLGIGVIILFLLLGLLVFPGTASAQTPLPDRPLPDAPTPKVQHFVMSTTAGSFGGEPVAIMSTGVQLLQGVSVAYEFISNPGDSSKPHIGSGVVNVTKSLSDFFPTAIKKKLLIDLTNYNLTFQGGAGVESLWNGAGSPRVSRIVGNFGLYPSYPLPGGHSQISVGYKWIVGGRGGLIKIPAGTLNFTF